MHPLSQEEPFEVCPADHSIVFFFFRSSQAVKLLHNLITSNKPPMWMVNKRNITASEVLSTVQTMQAFLNVNALPWQWWLTSACISSFDLCLLIHLYISPLLATCINTILPSFVYIVFCIYVLIVLFKKKHSNCILITFCTGTVFWISILLETSFDWKKYTLKGMIITAVLPCEYIF